MDQSHIIRERDRDAKRRELDRRRDRGEQQANLFFCSEDLAFIDKMKAQLGVANRSEVLRVLLSACRQDDRFAPHDPINHPQEEGPVPSGDP